MKTVLIISYNDWYINRLKFIKEVFAESGFNPIIVGSDFSHIKKEYIP